MRVFYHFRKVLVTGAAGFIGRALSSALEKLGARVVRVDLRTDPADFAETGPCIVGDIADETLMRRLLPGSDVVFNLAGRCSHTESIRDPLGDAAANCHAQLAFLEACRRWSPDARILYTSTRQVYGRVTRLPVDEAHSVAPLDINGVHKRTAEMYHQQYARLHGLHTVVVRLTNTYGPGMWIRDGRNCFIGHWIACLLANEPLPVFGDGLQRRDLNEVSDVVDALLRLGAAGREMQGELFNLGAPEALRLEEIAHLLVRLAGSDAGLRFEPFPEEQAKIELGDYQGDYGRIARRVGWAPTVGLEAGLRRTLASFGAGRLETVR